MQHVIYTMNNDSGKLYLVATPIGNLEDITIRALRTLDTADLILCEDTRQTIKLLNQYDIKNKLQAYHKFNEKKEVRKVINLLESGENIALVSDAGLPLISDPGSILVQECRKEGIPIEVIPGPNAALSALMLSGLDTSKFTFYGFPDKNKKKRREFFESIAAEPNTVIIYESPYQLVNTLETLTELIPDTIVSISREITKKFEETLVGTPAELLDHFKKTAPKGEFVIVIDKKQPNDNVQSDLNLEEIYNKLLSEGLTSKEAIKKTAEISGRKKRDVYNQLKIENK